MYYFCGMAQLLLPIFPMDTKFLSPTLGVKEQDGTVYYIHVGMPIYSHDPHDLTKFRYVTSNLILQGLCGQVDVCRVFCVSTDSVSRWKRRLVKEGESAFFNEEKRHGRSHKLLPDVLERIEQKLSAGKKAYSIAKEEGISEGSIRYALKQGYLKKNPHQKFN